MAKYFFATVVEADSSSGANDKMRAAWTGEYPTGMVHDLAVIHGEFTPEKLTNWTATVHNAFYRYFFETRKVA